MPWSGVAKAKLDLRRQKPESQGALQLSDGGNYASDRNQNWVSISSNRSSAAVLFVRGPRHLVFRRPCASHLSHVGCAVGRQGKGSVVAVGWLWDTLRQWWAAVTVLLGGAVGGQDTHASAVRDDDGPDAALWVRLVF